jgi:hypothetical protein
VTRRRLGWTVAGLLVLASIGIVAVCVLRDAGAPTEVWRTVNGTELHREPGGEVVDDYILLPCTDPSGERVDFVARRRSPLDALTGWPGRSGGGLLHRLDETETSIVAGGKRWHRFVVNEHGLTSEEAVRLVTGE